MVNIFNVEYDRVSGFKVNYKLSPKQVESISALDNHQLFNGKGFTLGWCFLVNYDKINHKNNANIVSSIDNFIFKEKLNQFIDKLD